MIENSLNGIEVVVAGDETTEILNLVKGTWRAGSNLC